MSAVTQSKKRSKKRKPKEMNGASEFYSRNRNFGLFQTETSNNTRDFRRDRYLQFQNRNNYFGRYYDFQPSAPWHGIEGAPIPWSAWPRNRRVQGCPRSQPAPPSFPARNYWQPFIPNPAANLAVTIPNFSGVHPPNVFRFGDPSAKRGQFAKSAPTSVFPRSACSNKNFRNVVFESNESDLSDDVQYLYTVQAKGGQLVEVVDLEENSKALKSDKFNSASSDAREYGNHRMSVKLPEKDTPCSKKQDAAPRRGTKRKNSSEDLQCDICASNYDVVRSRGGEIFKARCEHMFCQECLKELDPYKCPECDLYLQKLLKVFL